MLYCFPIAAVIDNYKRGGLNQHKFILKSFGGQKSKMECKSQAVLLLESVGVSSSPVFANF